MKCALQSSILDFVNVYNDGTLPRNKNQRLVVRSVHDIRYNLFQATFL